MIYLLILSIMIMVVFFIINKTIIQPTEGDFGWNFILFCLFFTPILNIMMMIGCMFVVAYLIIYDWLFKLKDKDDDLSKSNS